MPIHAVTIPKWGLAMEEGVLTSWLVNEGATIAPGDEVAEIETSKIANVLESQVSGTLRKHVVPEGETKPVGALIGVVVEGGDVDDAAIEAFIAEFESRFETEEAAQDDNPKPVVFDVDGKAMRYLEYPAGQDAGKTPVILIHGFGGDYENWAFNQASLAARRPVFAIDLPGHGSSGKDVGDGSLDTLADIVGKWMDEMSIAKAHIVGHSMGAGVAIALAKGRPERVASLTGIAGAGFGGTLNDDYVEGFLAVQRRKDMKPVAALLFHKDDLATREMLDHLISYKRIDGVSDALRKLIDNALSPESIAAATSARASLTLPVLAIYGAQDAVMRTPASDDRPENSVVIEEAGHMPHLEKAEDVNAKIAEFIDSAE